ncbi:DUF1858 domain-containing protein [Candidatus Peregrinibacteria bacterium]|nr:MAG: DUF1858 domain-containing protein [Candidatus Peregrinibacteria bacterium]
MQNILLGMPEKYQLITGDMTVQDIIDTYPEAADMLGEWGLGCSMCHIGAIESIADGAAAHGFTPEEIEDLLSDLNELAKSQKESEEKTNV